MLSDKSDNPTQDIPSHDPDPQDQQDELSPFGDPSIADLPAAAVAVVRREYDRLRTWYGRQPIRIGGVPRRPADVRRRMRELTAEHIAQVVRAYAEGWINSAVCGVQTALFNAPQFRRYAIAVGQFAPPEPPAAASTPGRSQPSKPRNAFCSFEQRTYDYDALERAFERQLITAYNG